jgi:hypothetical protein
MDFIFIIIQFLLGITTNTEPPISTESEILRKVSLAEFFKVWAFCGLKFIGSSNKAGCSGD